MNKAIINRPIQHGELILVPVDNIPVANHVEHASYILAHSESGHHHVLEAKTKFDLFIDEATKAMYIEIPETAKLVHMKTFDKHPTLTVAPGKYFVGQKTEYDPWAQVIRAVFD